MAIKKKVAKKSVKRVGKKAAAKVDRRSKAFRDQQAAIAADKAMEAVDPNPAPTEIPSGTGQEIAPAVFGYNGETSLAQGVQTAQPKSVREIAADRVAGCLINFANETESLNRQQKYVDRAYTALRGARELQDQAELVSAGMLANFQSSLKKGEK